jgi:hypothetical protein
MRRCAIVAYGGLCDEARRAYEAGHPDAAVDRLAKYVEDGPKLTEAHAVYALALLADDRADLWAAVELAKGQARFAIEAPSSDEAPRDLARMREVVDATAETLAQEAAADRAFALMTKRNDSKGALRPLFAAYPGPKPHATNVRFASEVWGTMPPLGRGRFALAVGHAMRSNVLRWYQATQPNATAWDVAPNRMTAMHMLGLCEHWASYARHALTTETLAPEAKGELSRAADELSRMLYADRFTVGP